jgi:hypothetical protein
MQQQKVGNSITVNNHGLMLKAFGKKIILHGEKDILSSPLSRALLRLYLS